MVGPFALDGYDVLAPLGRSGRSWRAVCLADGRPVVLRGCAGAGLRLAEVRRRVALWSSAAGAGIVAVRDVVCQGDDLVVVSDVAAGGGLDAVVRRRALSPGQVVTLVVGVGETLMRVHERGLAHGRISAGNIVLDDDGRPLLTDYLFGSDGEPSADVTMLAAITAECLPADAQPALVAALRSASDARTLVNVVRETVPAEPLTASTVVESALASDDGGDPSRTRRAVALVAASLVAAVVAGVWWGRQDPAAGRELPTRSPSMVVVPSALPTPSTSHPSWLAVVRGVELRRVRAIAAADVAQLSAVEVRDTALWRHDRETALRLDAARMRLRGLRVRVMSVHVVSTTAGHVVVRVVDAMSSYDVVNDRGAVLAHHPARQDRSVNLDLITESGHWQLYRATRSRRA